ncbi:UDP-N-acetylmuramoyl-L-alanyl-D-glutamate--2,6-diaminopimelate ligase [Bacteroidota bacterium]
MKQLHDILKEVKVILQTGPENPVIKSLCFDSRQVDRGSAFFAVPGTITDGHRYIDVALEAGAIAVICERIPEDTAEHVSYVQVEDSASALGMAASSFFSHPSRKLKVIGITGTNGKTTVATLLYNLFTEAGQICGLLSTVRNLIGNTENLASHTTPDSLQINQLLDEMAEAGCRYCFMEVSSHAIHQKRIAGIEFAGGIFTNLSHEHLDYHKTFKNYILAKKAFFDELPAGVFALVNRDDKNGSVMVQNCKASKSRYGLAGPAEMKGKVLESHMDGMKMVIGDREIWTRLVGRFNASNLLAVYGCALLCGMQQEEVLTILSRQAPVRGRFESLHSDEGVTAIIDYAHTPDALKNVLSTIAEVRKGKAGLITVVGAGGNRDTAKRPVMGQVAAEFSTKLILTSDNPRDEKPEEIIDQMMEGISKEKKKKVLSIPDRKQAIKTAIMMASAGDIILVAGKGHETYQEIEGKRYHFDDREILLELMKSTE